MSGQLGLLASIAILLKANHSIKWELSEVCQMTTYNTSFVYYRRHGPSHLLNERYWEQTNDIKKYSYYTNVCQFARSSIKNINIERIDCAGSL